MTDADVVRAAFDAYLRGDLGAALPLYADDLRFTSPQDDGIDREAFFERCFPTAARLRWQRVRHVVELGGGEVFVEYDYELAAGGTFRNVEVLTLRDGLIRDVQVFFGGASHAHTPQGEREVPGPQLP